MLDFHPLYEQSFENFIISDYIKTAHHLGFDPNAYFWRNSSSIEIDLLIEQGKNYINIAALKFSKVSDNIH